MKKTGIIKMVLIYLTGMAVLSDPLEVKSYSVSRSLNTDSDGYDQSFRSAKDQTSNPFSFAVSSMRPPASAIISGELKKWHRVTLTFSGPSLSETSSPNPFLDYRLNVTFTHSSGKIYKIPGYFAADGNAAQTSADSGNKWRVHFAPDEIGTWTYRVSFRQGPGIAVSDVENIGEPLSPLDGLTNAIIISTSDKTGQDLRSKGLLKYTEGHYLQFAQTGEYFVKGGADSPENFFAYDDFDNTPNIGARRKSWSPHLRDWLPDDPTWQSGKGKGIIGAINYLSAQGINAFSFLTMNIRGDDQNVFPYISSSAFTRFDVSKLDQWEIVMEHAQKMGMYLHFKLQETENNKLLDGGNLGTQRKLYLRELIARFSHHLALNWNVGEENTQSDKQRKDMAQYLYDHDPYRHPIVIHTYPGQQEQVYRPLIGGASRFSGVSIQTDVANVYNETKKWVKASAVAGKKWVVANDEQGSAQRGVAADAEYTGKRGSFADNSDEIRKNVLWGNLMAGGAGVEYYFGYQTGETDLTAQDFRSRAKSWRYAAYALDFFKSYLPLNEMEPLEDAASGWVLGKEGEVYLVYLKDARDAHINLPAGVYDIKWYNPRSGGKLQTGSFSILEAGTNVSLGDAPEASSLDWAVLISKQAPVPVDTPLSVKLLSPPGDTIYTAPAVIKLSAMVAGKPANIRRVEFYSDSTRIGIEVVAPYNFMWENVPPGSYRLTAKAFDSTDVNSVSDTVPLTVTPSVYTTGQVVFAVNSGGAAYTASNGITYQADTNFRGGSTYRIIDDIGNTADDPLYQTERYGNFNYSIPLNNGTYEVTFKFSEIYQQALDRREFDVFMEGVKVIDNLDLYAAAGYGNAYDAVRIVTITDSVLNLFFSTHIDNAKISAFHVKTISPPADSLLTLNPAERVMQTAPPAFNTSIFIPEKVSVYPNPGKGIVNISTEFAGPYRLNIYNSQGINLYSNQFAGKQEQVDLSRFGPGIYIVQCRLEARIITRKILVE